MPVVISPDSDLGKELARWDTPRNQQVMDSGGNPTGIQGMKCVGFEAYPKMLYKARKHPNGKVSVGDVPPNPYHYTNPSEFERACLLVENFNASCQKKVGDEEQERLAFGQGWRATQEDALKLFEEEEQALAQAAAEAAASAKRMTPKAQEELKAADAQTHEHVTDVAPTRNARGRTTGKKGAKAVVRRPVED